MVTSMIAGTAAIPGGAAAAPGDVVHRVNAGDSTVAATDGGPDWAASDGTYVSGGSTYSQAVSVSTDASVPASTPTSVFQSELYGDQQWAFSENVQSGQTYEVRLYFAEIYHGVDGGNSTGGAGDRVFDVAVEDETVLDDYDIYADVGSATGVMKSFTVTPADGQIDVDLSTVEDNAKISAIEIVDSEPEPDTLGGPSEVDFGDVVVDDSETESVTLTNLGGDGDADITIDGVSVSGDGVFSAGTASQTTLSPGESADVPVMFAPTAAQASSATLSIDHSGSNSPLSVDLSGNGASAVDPSFQKSALDGFSAGNPTAIDFGPDGRAYVSTQGGTVYALNVTRTGENSYEVVNEVQIDAIEDIPNHDDFGNLEPGQDNRQITGLTVGGTAAEPVVYVSSSDPEITVGQDDDSTDTNSGAISRLTVTPGSDGVLQAGEVDHEVLVLGLPRSEENHATNGLDLSADGETLYVAQGGHTNKGAPGDNFGHTPEYALSAAILEIDLAQIGSDYQATSLQTQNGDYPDLDYLYALPTVQGSDLPFGGKNGVNQATLVEGGPVQIYSAGYRNPYDLVVGESGQVYAADHGPNGGWGGQPADANGDTTADAATVTNHPNEDGSYTTSDQLVVVDEGDYGGHAAPIRANPTGADVYDANGDLLFDINESNSPVPESMVDPREADYIPPTSGSPDPGAPAGSANTMEFENGDKVLFGPTGGVEQYTASNFGGAMDGDLLQLELGGDVERVELSDDGSTVVSVETIANTAGPLGIVAQGDDGEFAGTVWTADIGGNGVTVLEPVDYGADDGDGGSGATCTGADDPSLDEDGDGYDNADEIDAGTDPCSSASTPADFDDDGTSNLNDPDDDDDGLNDTEDPFAVDPNNGLDATLPVQHDLSELSLFGANGQGWTGLMTNGTDYQELYDPTQMTVGGAAEVLTVEGVPQGDAYADTNTQQYAFQFGVDPPAEPFTVESTVASFPENPEDYQSAGIYVGTGTQSDYAKLVVAADGGNGGVEFAQEEGDSFTHQTSPNVVSDANVTGTDTTLRLTVDPTTDPTPNNGEDEVALVAEYEVDGETIEVGTAAIPASWLDTSDGTGLAVGVVSTSNGAGSSFDATWTDIGVDYVTPPANEPPVADAGADQTVGEGQQVTLDGSGSADPNGDQLGYTWIQTAGPDAGLSQSDGETAAFTAPEVDTESTLEFQLSVSDGQNSDTDEVNVTVQPAAEEPPAGDTMTVAEAIATGGDDDSLIEDAEIQQAINWWATDGEVPDTGGETIGDSEIQQLINYWATATPVGDANDPPAASFTASPDAPEAGQQVSFDASGSGDDGSIASYEWDFDGDGATDASGEQATTAFDAAGDYAVTLTVTDDDGAIDSVTQTVTVTEPAAEPGAASVSVTPDTDTEASTYSGGSFTVENTGDQPISSVTFDLSSAAMPDMVFDPDGTAGDQAAKGLVVDGESGDGVGVASTADDDVFGQPHNGVNGSDGYDALTVEFTDFDPGESVSFSADNDPTSIKAASMTSQEAGPVSGLELARSTVSVQYADGSAQEAQLFGDGSAGGAQATVDESVAPAPSIDVQGVDLDEAALRGHHSAATVSEADQTVTVTGEPGETATLLHVESELELDTVPDYDGTPGYDIEPYEGNKVENVDYQTVTLDSNGEAEVPVTLLNTTAVGGYNYFVATHGEPGSDTGLGSNAVVLKYDESAGGDDGGPEGDVVYAVNAGGPEYTASDGTVYQASTNFTGGTTQFTSGQAGTPSEPEIANTQNDELYWTELYGSDFNWSASVDNGQYEVTLKFVELYQGVANDGGEGDRIFDVSIEGQETLDNYDIIAESGGPQTAINETFTVEVTDGELNVGFDATEDDAVDNAKISAIKVTEVSDTNTPPTVQSISDQTVTEGDSATVPVSADDPDGDSVSLSVSGPDFVSLSNGELSIAPESGDAGTYAVEVTADDGQGTATESFQLTVEEPAATGPGSADVAVTPNGGIDASTYSGGSFEITNTGDQQISSVTFDAGQSLIPDAVFDPDGTAGDATAKQLSVDGQSGDGVGVVSTADGDVFSQPHNGQDDAEGYDVMTVAFDDFDPGESVSMSIDMDPTTIKGASTTGGAGSVSGLEIAGSEVTAEYVDGSTQSSDLFGDGSDGGAQTTLDGNAPAAPTLGVDGVSLQSTDFPAHEAAAVGDGSQTLTLSGPADGTLELLHVEASEPPTDGYDLDAFEADNAQSVSYQTVTLDSSGQATVPVSLSETDLNYFVAATESSGGDTGQTSDTVVLEYDDSAGDGGSSTQQVLHRVNAGEGTTISATDDGPDWTGVVDTSSPYLASVASSDVGTSCVGEITSTTANVPSSTPDGVWDCERYGEMTWEFDVDPGQQIEVRLYVGNSYSGASEPGDRQFNVSVEGQQVLSQYDPVADVGHETGTVKNATVTDDGDGTVTVSFEETEFQNPQIRAIEIVESEGTSQ
ncbi:hypothetical protein DJ82_06360 [Halorubrum sp. Ib24]|nr:hypothetical protein DJ82_06360 [Halorubrum sp. Ib24]